MYDPLELENLPADDLVNYMEAATVARFLSQERYRGAILKTTPSSRRAQQQRNSFVRLPTATPLPRLQNGLSATPSVFYSQPSNPNADMMHAIGNGIAEMFPSHGRGFANHTHQQLNWRQRQEREETRAAKRALIQDFKHFDFFPEELDEAPFRALDHNLVYRDKDPRVLKFSAMVPPPLPPSVDSTRYEFIDACLPVQMNHLKMFDRKEHAQPVRGSIEDRAFAIAICHVGKLLTLEEKLEMPTVHSLGAVRFDRRKFPGLYYARNGLKNRISAHPQAWNDAVGLWNNLLTGNLVEPHDVRLGGKGKLVQMNLQEAGHVSGDPNSNAMGRLILMLSHRDLLVLGALEHPLTESYLDSKWPINVGQSWYHAGAETFTNKLAKFVQYHCFDAKKFDTAIDGWLARKAINILRDQYMDGLNPKYDTLWEFVYNSLIEVTICRDDGIRMKKHVGTTSGNSFNSLVQSVITLIIGYTTLAMQALKEGSTPQDVFDHSWLEAMGDDTVMALNAPWDHLTKEVLANSVRDIFGIDWSGKKSFSTRKLLDDTNNLGEEKFKGVQFLGKYFRHQRLNPAERYSPKVIVPYRPFQETYLSLLFPRQTGKALDSWLRAIGNYLDGAGNDETRAWLEAYLDFLEREHKIIAPSFWPEHMEKKVTRDYSGTGRNAAPPPVRISYTAWLALSCVPEYGMEF